MSGIFLNRDPIEEQGGLNLYAFVGNDPVNQWDYLGLSICDCLCPDLCDTVGATQNEVKEVEVQMDRVSGTVVYCARSREVWEECTSGNKCMVLCTRNAWEEESDDWENCGSGPIMRGCWSTPGMAENDVENCRN